MAIRLKRGHTGRTRLLFKGQLATPAGANYAPILDTTNDLPSERMDAPAAVAAVPSPGANVGLALGRLYGLTINCTGQNVTLLQYMLLGSGAWFQFASTVIVAGTPQAFSWDPSAYGTTDILILALTGATPPTAIYSSLTERDLP